ncbi:MAG TPA: TonB-dependent receptor [Bryobacteraceae bacterium]
MKAALGSFVVGVIFCGGVSAQAVSTAQVNGTVRDASGAAVPGAGIRVTQTGTGQVRTANSGADGSYVLPNLPVGPYLLEVSKSGFAKYVQTGIVLEVGGNPTIDVSLKIGQTTEQVVVQANAALVETTSDNLGTVVDQQRVIELPLNGREATQLIFLSGMANTGNGTNLNTIRNYPSQLISVAGGQGNGITYLLDGGTHNDVMNSLNLPLPFPDALQEFKVETNALPAQYGLHASAAVNAVTKSGTNAIHGDLFEFFRNGDLNARDTFATARDSLKRNQYGGVLGGPLRKDKLFFFAGYQGTIIRSNPPQTIAYVPTAAALQGNFSVLASPSCNGTRQINLPGSLGFVNNTIPATMLSPAALKISTFLPATSDPCGRTTYGLLSNSDESLGVARIDYQISPKNSFFGRILLANLSGPGSYNGANALTFNNASSLDRDTAVVLGDTYLIGSGTVNSARATVTRTRVEKVSDQFESWANLGVTGIYQFIPDFSRVTVSGNGFGFGNANETPSKFNTGPTIQGADDLSLVRGSHQLGFGVNYIHEVMNFKSGLNTPGGFTFSGQVTGLSMADFLLGDASSFTQGSFSVGYNRQNYIGLYAQDTWKVTSRLTLSYGLRWEPYIAPYSTFGHISNFNPALFAQGVHSTIYPNAPAGTIFPGDPQYTAGNAPENSTWNLWAPRLGIVWDPFGDGKTSIRAAAGIFTDRQHLFYLDAYANDAPFGNSVTTGAVNFSNPWATTAGGNPFPIVLNAGTRFPIAAGVVTHQLNAKPTILQQWNFNVQRQIGTDWLVSVNYIGNQTTHLWTGNQEDPAVFLGLGPCAINGVNYNPCSSIANTNQRRMLYLQNPAQGQYYGAIAQQDTGGTATYHALYLQLQRRLSKGLTVQANYTWSHCISDVENTELGTAGPTYSVPFNREIDRSNCALSDVRRILNLTTVYQTPQFSGKMLRVLASNWQVSTAIQAKSAQLFTVTSGIDFALDGQGAERPNQVLSNPYLPHAGPNGWLNPAAFANPATGSVTGNLGAVNLAGPGSLQFDMALSRLFAIRERTTLQVRFEAFNVLNTVNFSAPVATLNSGNFGQIISDISGSQTGGLVANTGDPRILQLAMKLLF